MEALGRDVGAALRQLRKSPGFAVTAILTLALGIGATTAIFTLVQQVMLRSLPVQKPQQLWRIGDAVGCCFSLGYTQKSATARNDWSLFSWNAYRFFRANTPTFEELAAFQVGEGNAELGVRRAGSAAPVQARNGRYVSGNFFRTFGISAARGRVLTAADDRQGAAPVAVMSFRAWQEKYGADPSVVGASFDINGTVFTVIGVAPQGFFGVVAANWGVPDFWLPLAQEPLIAGRSTRLNDPRAAWLDLIGRVRPGTNVKALEARLQGELHNWLASHVPDMNPREKAAWQKQSLHLTPGGSGVSLMRARYRSSLWLLLLAAVCVLLVGCANVANLLLARGLKDRQQTAVRAALGASRARLVRKAFTESMVLGVIGGAAGVGVAYAGARIILHLAFGMGTPNSWLPIAASPSPPVLLFALSVSVVTGLIFGVAPAWTTSRAVPLDAMRGANGTVGGTRQTTQRTLVVVQAAVSLVLLSTAAMLGQSLRNMEHQNFGFDPAGRYLVGIDPQVSGISQAQLVPLFQRIQSRLAVIPGVRGVAAVLEAPPSGWMTHDIRIQGRPASRADSNAGWTRVTPGFFKTLGDRIVGGRPITDEDDAAARPVAVVNEAFAREFFGNENPIGQHFGPVPQKNAGMYEIVGVAANVAFSHGLEKPMYFLPEAQSTHFDRAATEAREVWSHYLYDIVIWAPGKPAAPAGPPGLAAQVKRTLANIDPDLVLYRVRPYASVIHDDFAQEEMVASLTWLFSAVGLVLAAVGLYGVTAYGVERRTNEIGLRMALGADHRSVVGLVLRGAFLQVAIGLALGIPAATAAGELIAGRLFGVRPWDPLILCGAALTLGIAALTAAGIAARRAAGVDPMRALHSE